MHCGVSALSRSLNRRYHAFVCENTKRLSFPMHRSGKVRVKIVSGRRPLLPLDKGNNKDHCMIKFFKNSTKGWVGRWWFTGILLLTLMAIREQLQGLRVGPMPQSLQMAPFTETRSPNRQKYPSSSPKVLHSGCGVSSPRSGQSKSIPRWKDTSALCLRHQRPGRLSQEFLSLYLALGSFAEVFVFSPVPRSAVVLAFHGPDKHP